MQEYNTAMAKERADAVLATTLADIRKEGEIYNSGKAFRFLLDTWMDLLYKIIYGLWKKLQSIRKTILQFQKFVHLFLAQESSDFQQNKILFYTFENTVKSDIDNASGKLNLRNVIRGHYYHRKIFHIWTLFLPTHKIKSAHPRHDIIIKQNQIRGETGCLCNG